MQHGQIVCFKRIQRKIPVYDGDMAAFILLLYLWIRHFIMDFSNMDGMVRLIFPWSAAMDGAAAFGRRKRKHGVSMNLVRYL